MSKIFNKMDKILLILTIVMFVFGLFMVLDASSMKSFLMAKNMYIRITIF